MIAMAYVVSHDGHGKAYNDYPTPESFALDSPVQDLAYPQDFINHPHLPQIYGDLPYRDLGTCCVTCGRSDIGVTPELSSSNPPSPGSEVESVQRKTVSRRSRNTKNYWGYGKQNSQQAYNTPTLEISLEPSWYFDEVEEFISRQRSLNNEGWPIEKVFGKETINVQAFFTPEQQSIEPVTVAEWVVYATQSPDTLGVPERLGFMLLGALLLRVSKSA